MPRQKPGQLPTAEVNFKGCGPTPFLLYINDIPDDVICNNAIYADDTTLYSKSDQASDLSQQLELASELESHLQDTADWVRSGLLISVLGKVSCFCLTGLNR